MKTFLKSLLFISLLLQYDKEIHNNFATLFLCTFSVSRHMKFCYHHFSSNYFSLLLLGSISDKAL